MEFIFELFAQMLSSKDEAVAPAAAPAEVEHVQQDMEADEVNVFEYVVFH